MHSKSFVLPANPKLQWNGQMAIYIHASRLCKLVSIYSTIPKHHKSFATEREDRIDAQSPFTLFVTNELGKL